jgi:multidrug efflux pump subunit AcrA (membrane-fusion protein)
MSESPEPGRPRVWRWAVGAGVVLVVVLTAVALRGPVGVPVSTARAARLDLVVPILSDGTLEPPPGGELRAPEAARIAAILARDGERVSKGTRLVELENSELSQAALQARAAALQLSEEGARAAADLEQARREAAHAREVFEADARLLKESAISRAMFEADELAFRQAQDRLRVAQARLDSIEGASGRRSRHALVEMQAREFDQRAAALTLRASIDGIAYGLPGKAGEMVSAGQIVAGVADPEHLRVRARVDQPDLPRIQVGQRFLVSFDGLPDRRWEGKVLFVSNGVREVAGREVGEVLGEISDPKLSLPPNASVNVQIVVGERHGALAIPRAALFRDGDRKFVYRLEDGRARRREVSVGLVGVNDVEVTNGLQEKDAVILPGVAPLSDGMRVNVAKGS